MVPDPESPVGTQASPDVGLERLYRPHSCRPFCWSEWGRPGCESRAIVVHTTTRLYESVSAELAMMMPAWGANALERRRYELEQGTGAIVMSPIASLCQHRCPRSWRG